MVIRASMGHLQRLILTRFIDNQAEEQEGLSGHVPVARVGWWHGAWFCRILES